MSADEATNGRYRRTRPLRDQPLRNFSTLFGPRPVPAPERTEERDQPVPQVERTTTDPERVAPPVSAVIEGVRTGYQVIDEYLELGCHAARSESVAPEEPAPPENPARRSQVAERMLQYASDFVSVWLELMQTTVLGAAPPQPRQGEGAGPFRVHPAPGALTRPPEVARSETPSSVACVVELSSTRKVSVQWSLLSDAHEVEVRELRSAGSDPSTLHCARIVRRSDPDRIALVLAVPDEQPPGAYSGLIVDSATNAPAGSLFVLVYG